MASPAVTYTFTNDTSADAGQVNTNFSDLIAAMTDGTKDFSISALTLAGALTANGNVTLGNASNKDITFTGSMASSLPIKTQRSFDIGSANLGLRIAYLGGNDAHTVALCAPSSGMAADYTLTVPSGAGTNGHGMQSNGSGALSFAPMQTDINAVASGDYTVTDTDGYKHILVTTGASTRTITLPTAADNTDRMLVIKKVDSGAGFVTIDGEGSETIDGAASYSLMLQYESVTLVCNGSAWYITDYIPSNWTSWTVVASWTGNVTWTGFWRKNGKMAEFDVHGAITGSPTPSSTALTINLPSGVTTDTAVLSSTGSARQVYTSMVCAVDESGSPDVYYGGFVTHDTNKLAIRADDGSQWAVMTHNFPLPFANLDSVSIRAIIPIATT